MPKNCLQRFLGILYHFYHSFFSAIIVQVILQKIGVSYLMNATEKLKQAERGAILSIATYILLSIAKLVVGRLFFSEALFADGLNNFTDVISSVLVFAGLKISQRPADTNHPYGHWKFETVASLITSFIMFFIGIEVLRNAWDSLQTAGSESPSLITAIVGFLSGLVMFGVYYYNRALANRIQSLGLKAAAKDNLSDAITSISTAIAVLAASFGLTWLDTLMAFIVGVIILKTAFDVFNESTFQLTDGFEPGEIKQYEPCILSHPEVKEIHALKARRYGSNVYIDLTVRMDPNLTVWRSHEVTEEIEQELNAQFGITIVDIHVEPYKQKNHTL